MTDELLHFLEESTSDMRRDLRELVEIESPSDAPDALKRCAAHLARRGAELTSGRAEMIDQPEGPHLQIITGSRSGAPVLLLGHFDTVWPVGTIRARPYRDDGEIARGPGAFDMKAGLVQGLWAIAALNRFSVAPPAVHCLFNSDEEIQSIRSRSLIERAASRARAVFVLEPSLDGALKVARKGTARFTVRIHGRAAHSGLNPEAGRSAIAELARVIDYAHSLANSGRGTSVNVGVVHGGTRPNVIAAEAVAEVDVRFTTKREGARVMHRLTSLERSRRKSGIDVEVEGGIGRPPMRRTAQVNRALVEARRIGKTIGIDVRGVAVGGASDANFCAPLGIPVLDGLGAVGGGAHADDEYVLVREMPRRAALVAGLIASETGIRVRRR